jgi:hypothetical protein
LESRKETQAKRNGFEKPLSIKKFRGSLPGPGVASLEMRRWMEFGGVDTFSTKPQWQLSSNTTRSRKEFAGDFPPVFISMPYKADLLRILQGTSLYGYEDFSLFVAEIRSGGSMDAPAADCTAEHVSPGANPYGWRVGALWTGGIWAMILGGFPQPAGGVTPPLFTFNSEPPSENG